MLTQPYIAYMRDAAGGIFKVAWVLKPGGLPLPFDTAFGSSRYLPDNDASYVEVGEQRTTEFVRSPIRNVPDRVCNACYVGDATWFTGTWPDDAPPVVLADDSFAVDCDGSCFMCLKRVGLSADPTFVVSNSPLTADGTISLDWADVPAGYVLAGPVSGPDDTPTFRAFASGTEIIRVRLTTPATTVPLLAFTTTISFGSGSPAFSCSVPSDMNKINPGMLCGTFGARPDGFVAKVDQAGNVGQLSTDSAGPATTTAVFTPFGYGWIEQAMDADTGQLFDKPGGRSGTISTGPAFEISTDPVNVDVNSYGWLAQRGTTTGGIPVYDFVQDRSFRYSVPPVGIQNQTTSVTWDIFGSSGSPTTINLNANVNLLVWNGTTLVNLFVGGKVNPVLLNGPTCGNVLANTTATFATVFQLVAVNAIMGGFNLQNLGPNTLRYRLTATDAHGGPFSGTGTLPSGTTIGATDFMTSLSFFSGSIQSPCNSITFEVEDNSAGSHTQYRCWWVAQGC